MLVDWSVKFECPNTVVSYRLCGPTTNLQDNEKKKIELSSSSGCTTTTPHSVIHNQRNYNYKSINSQTGSDFKGTIINSCGSGAGGRTITIYILLYIIHSPARNLFHVQRWLCHFLSRNNGLTEPGPRALRNASTTTYRRRYCVSTELGGQNRKPSPRYPIIGRHIH